MVKNLLGVYNKNVGTAKFHIKCQALSISTMLLLNWQHQIALYLLFFFFLLLEIQPLQECNNFLMLNPVWKLDPFPDVNLGTTAELGLGPH